MGRGPGPRARRRRDGEPGDDTLHKVQPTSAQLGAPECGERTDRTQESHGPRVSRGHGGSRSGLEDGVKDLKKSIPPVTGVGASSVSCPGVEICGRVRGGNGKRTEPAAP